MLLPCDARLYFFSALAVLSYCMQSVVLMQQLRLDSNELVDVGLKSPGGLQKRLLVLTPVEVGLVQNVGVVALLKPQLFCGYGEFDFMFANAIVGLI